MSRETELNWILFMYALPLTLGSIVIMFSGCP